MLRIIALLTLLLSLILLTACSSDSNNADDPPQDDAPLSHSAPAVDAGEDVTVVAGTQVQLNGSVEDDGLPNATLVITWEKLDGPGEVTFSTTDSLMTEVVFSSAGAYQLQLSAYDGDLTGQDTVEVAVTSADVDPATQNPGEFMRVTHDSGLSLEYRQDSVLPDSTDLDWMYRLWQGMVSCQGGAEVPYPTIRLVERIVPQDGDRYYEENGPAYTWNYTAQSIEVLNTDTAIAKGPDQGLLLGEAISVYLGFYENEGFPDPSSFNGFQCHRWHAGGRWQPTPQPEPLVEPVVLHDINVQIQDAEVRIQSDTEAVDASTLTYVGVLYERLLECHQAFTETAATLGRVQVLSAPEPGFHGDRWSDTGAYSVRDGGTILIHADDLLDIRNNPTWGQALYTWINAYLDASRNGSGAVIECADQSGPFPSILPLQLED